MVARCLNDSGVGGGGRAVIVDLDGTLVRVNTLHLYLRMGLRRLVHRCALHRAAAVAALLLLRKLHLISHEAMKYRSISLIGDDAAFKADFARRVADLHNDAVERYLAEARERGCRVLLATAAAGDYVPLLWSGDYIASPAGGPDLRGERKRDAVAAWLAARGLAPAAVLTDSAADLPLALWARDRAAQVIIINPSPRSAATFRHHGFTDIMQ